MGRYSIRGNDKEHRRRLKGGECILKAYKEDHAAVVEVVDADMKLFYMASETFPGIKYRVSLRTYSCDCPARHSTCKHIIGLHLIEEEFPFVPQSTEIGEEQMGEIYFPIDETSSPLREEISNMGGCNEDERRSECKKEAQDLCLQLEELMSNLILSIDHGTIEEAEQKKYLLQRAVASMSMLATFQRPPTIDLPRRGASIKPQQANVTRTQVGHGQKQKKPNVEAGSSSQPLSTRAAHVFVTPSKRKRTKFLKVPKIHCPSCTDNVMVVTGDQHVVCKNCDTTFSVE